jgi:hypothetical protein
MSDSVALTQEQEAERQRQAQAIESEMVAQGVSPTEEIYEDYFGFSETERVNLPDGKSYVEFKVMNEGDRRQYLNAQNRKVTIRKGSGDAELELTPGDDKYNLLKLTLTGWNLRRAGQPVVFNKHELDKFLNGANPKVIDLIHREVTLKHPWLLDQMTVEDIDREIENLQKMREIAAKNEAGN